MKTVLPESVRRRLDPAERFGLRITLLAIAVILVAVPFGWLLAQVTSDGWFVRVDTAAANGLHEQVRRAPWVVDVLQAVSFLAKPVFFYFLVGGVGAFLLWRRRRRLTAFLVATSLGGGAVDTAVKVAVGRPRPSLEEPVATAFGKSFPSGHSMMAMVIYGALVLVFLPAVPRRRRVVVVWAAAGLIAAIGFSRLALGVHYISDVLGAYALGAAWLAASVAAFSIWREELGRSPVEPREGLEPDAASDLAPGR